MGSLRRTRSRSGGVVVLRRRQTRSMRTSGGQANELDVHGGRGRIERPDFTEPATDARCGIKTDQWKGCGSGCSFNAG